MSKIKKSSFDLNHQFNLYLERAEVKKEQLSLVQHQEMKRAFFGACGQMLILQRDELTQIKDDNEAAEVLQSMLNQVVNFWSSELFQLSCYELAQGSIQTAKGMPDAPTKIKFE